MKRQFQVLVVMVLLFGFSPTPDAQAPPKPFGLATAHWEQNATDGDVEVLFEATGDRNGLVQLAIVAPDGRTVVDFKAPKGSMGIRQFRFESPEPSDAALLRAAYPAGVYRFSGTTSKGVPLQGQARLSHALPSVASIMRPGAGADAQNLEIGWSAVKGAAAYVVSIEQEDQNLSVTARLPGTATRFVVPEGFAVPGTEYKVAVGAVTSSGNASFVETTVRTAARAPRRAS